MAVVDVLETRGAIAQAGELLETHRMLRLERVQFTAIRPVIHRARGVLLIECDLVLALGIDEIGVAKHLGPGRRGR